MPPTSMQSLGPRDTTYDDCTDYPYLRQCQPHRIIIGAIVCFVMFIIIVIVGLLCVRHRKHNALRARARAQATHRQNNLHPYPHAQKHAFMRMDEMEPEIAAPPPAYARFDPESGVRRGV